MMKKMLHTEKLIDAVGRIDIPNQYVIQERIMQ